MSNRIKLPSSGKPMKHYTLPNMTGKQHMPYCMKEANVPDSEQKPPTEKQPTRQSYNHKSSVTNISVPK
jgi:hypothetical protein